MSCLEGPLEGQTLAAKKVRKTMEAGYGTVNRPTLARPLRGAACGGIHARRPPGFCAWTGKNRRRKCALYLTEILT
jgi:hypothetical protein